MPQGFEWLILALVVLLLFGAKRMPEAARGLGRSLRIFKAETRALSDHEADATTPDAPSAITSAQDDGTSVEGSSAVQSPRSA